MACGLGTGPAEQLVQVQPGIGGIGGVGAVQGLCAHDRGGSQYSWKVPEHRAGVRAVLEHMFGTVGAGAGHKPEEEPFVWARGGETTITSAWRGHYLTKPPNLGTELYFLDGYSALPPSFY